MIRQYLAFPVFMLALIVTVLAVWLAKVAAAVDGGGDRA